MLPDRVSKNAWHTFYCVLRSDRIERCHSLYFVILCIFFYMYACYTVCIVSFARLQAGRNGHWKNSSICHGYIRD